MIQGQNSFFHDRVGESGVHAQQVQGMGTLALDDNAPGDDTSGKGLGSGSHDDESEEDDHEVAIISGKSTVLGQYREIVLHLSNFSFPFLSFSYLSYPFNVSLCTVGWRISLRHLFTNGWLGHNCLAVVYICLANPATAI